MPDGGDAVLRRLVDQVRRDTGLDPRADAAAMARLRQAAGRAAGQIRVHGRAAVTLPALMRVESGPYHLTMTLTRRDLEEGDG